MRILAVGAHLDDIELACGGTLAKAVRQGHEVKMVVMSDSAYTNYTGRVLRAREQALAEGRAAASVLGVTDIDILDFPTKDVPYNSTAVEALDRIITAFNPDVIFTHWPYDTHQAHRATSLATISAARYFNSILMYEPINPSGRSYEAFRPQVYVDITATIEQKIEALKAHTSQYQKYGDRWLDAIRARALLRGFDMQGTYAETFEVVRLEMKL